MFMTVSVVGRMRSGGRGHIPVGTDPSINPVEQPLNSFYSGPTYWTLIHVWIMTRPIAQLVKAMLRDEGSTQSLEICTKITPVWAKGDAALSKGD
jgi:hypothetical protein